MKKILCFFLIFATIFAFVACNKGPSAEDVEFELQGVWEAAFDAVEMELAFCNGMAQLAGKYGKKDSGGDGTYTLDIENSLIKIEFEDSYNVDYFDRTVIYKYNEKTGEISFYVTIDSMIVQLKKVS